MTLYENDSFIRIGVRPEYVLRYRGFCVGGNYSQTQMFSSRTIKLGEIWPNQNVRNMWTRIRNTQIMTVPGGI